jgi:hypothetical protein
MLIEFSEFNFKLILFLIYPISIRIQDYSNEAYIKEDKDNRCYLSFIFSGVPLLIFKLNTKKKKKKEGESSPNKIEVENGKNSMNILNIQLKKYERIKLYKLILFLFLLSMIGLFSFYASYYFSSSDYTYPKYSVRTFFQITHFFTLSYFL